MAPEPASALRQRLRSRRRRPSFWFDDAEPRRVRPPLRGEHRADVAVVGAGLAGLGVACAIYDRRPGSRIVVIDADVAGGGGSGASVGASSALPGLLAAPALAPELVAVFRTGLLAVSEQLAAWSVDAGLRPGPAVAIASERSALARLGAAMRATHAAGAAVGDPQWLEGGTPSRRLVLHGADAMLQIDAGLVLHPGRLSDGLVRRFESSGGELFEHSPVRSVDSQGVTVDGGRVTAGLVVVAAALGTAQLLPVVGPLVERTRTWHHLVTEPIDELSWERLGWAAAVQLHAEGRHGDERARRTPDDRLLWSWTPPRWRGVALAVPGDPSRRVLARLTARVPATIPVRAAQAWSQPTVAHVRGPGHGRDRRSGAWWLVNVDDDPLETLRRALGVAAEVSATG